MGKDSKNLDQIAQKGFGHGCSVTGELGSNNSLAAILDYELLKADAKILYDDSNASTLLEAEGSNYESANQSLNEAFGCSLDIQQGNDKKDSFPNSLAIASGSLNNSENIHEFAMKLFINKICGVSLAPMSVNDIKKYMLKSAFNHINGIKAEGEDSILYPTEDYSAYVRLFQAYGTHLVTKAIYGCKYEYFYAREYMEWESSRTTQVNLNLSMAFPYGTKFNDTLKVGSTYDFTETDKECQKNDRHVSKERRVGGDTSISDPDLWQLSCHTELPGTVDMIGYIYPTSSQDNGLVPIWEFVEDNHRKQEMKDAFDTYVAECTKKQIKYKKVIADVYGRQFDGETPPDYFYQMDYTGEVMRKFYKLAPDIFDFISASTDGHYHFYYALGYSNNAGLTGIEFMDEGDPNGSTVIGRGDNSQKGVTGCLTNRIVAITKALPGTPEADLISGFGVDIEKEGKKISSGTTEDFNWESHGSDWYKGLSHHKIHCITTKDTLLY